MTDSSVRPHKVRYKVRYSNIASDKTVHKYEINVTRMKRNYTTYDCNCFALNEVLKQIKKKLKSISCVLRFYRSL